MRCRDTLRRDSRRFVRSLQLPPAGSVRDLLPVVEEITGHPIRLEDAPVDSGQGVCGMWVRTVEGSDHIFVHKDTTRAHQDHIIAHELGHILRNHNGGASLPQAAPTAERLTSTLDPAVVKLMLGRSNYQYADEREAELIGSYLQRHVHRRSVGGDHGAARTLLRIRGLEARATGAPLHMPAAGDRRVPAASLAPLETEE